MNKINFHKKVVKDNLYLLLASIVLLALSIFFQYIITQNFLLHSFQQKHQRYIKNAESDFSTFCADTMLLKNAISDSFNDITHEKYNHTKAYYFIYKNTTAPSLIYWNTQTVVPNLNTLNVKKNVLVFLDNGYYYVQKKNVSNAIFISLLPIKWQYEIVNNYLQNDFLLSQDGTEKIDINFQKGAYNIVDNDNNFLFSLSPIKSANKIKDNEFTNWLRILSLIPLLLFIHFSTINIKQKKGGIVAALFLVSNILFLRVLTYTFDFVLNLRQFQLFNPSIYGSGVIFKSLGDLLINILFLLWIILFVYNHVSIKKQSYNFLAKKYKYVIVLLSAVAIIAAIYFSTFIIRSLVSDSQISFDVTNFFSLDIHSIIGFLVLCFVGIIFYYFCNILLIVVNILFPKSILIFTLILSVLLLLLLSCRIGALSGGFEIFQSAWLIAFIFLLNAQITGFKSSTVFVSRIIFWGSIFSLSIASVVVWENSNKELKNRKHYAEMLATKSNAINDILLNTISTEFRADVLSTIFEKFKYASTAYNVRDSLINNNFNSYNNNYDTKILVYDEKENGLFNLDATKFNTINSVLQTQAKATTVEDMYAYNTGYEITNYITKRIIKNDNNQTIGFVFVIISPKNIVNNKVYPLLFTRGTNNYFEKSLAYAYALYENGKLVQSHNEYAFSSRYIEKKFTGNQFIENNTGKYNELWYNAGGYKYIVIVKANNTTIELITLFSYLFLLLILLNAILSFITLIIHQKFKWQLIKNNIQLNLKQQIHSTIIAFSILSFFIICIATIFFFTNRYQNNSEESLSRNIKTIQTDLADVLTAQMLDTTIFEHKLNTTSSINEIINKLSELYNHDINLYDLNGNLKASSLSLPYEKGIVSTKINPEAYFHLRKKNEIQFYQKEKIGDLYFISSYTPLSDKEGNDIAFLNIPNFTSQTKLNEEISTFLVTIINLNAFILLIAGIVALSITNRITNSFSFISKKMKEINFASKNEIIVWNRKDEIGDLVNEYNKMVSKLDESAAQLAKTERENAWQEMAKQIAHEIKNPLTPMKLSIQFLQKAINENASNIKELSASVSATLVEQMDYLSNIASEFSNFANIEKNNPERLDIIASINAITQLYIGNDKVKFICENVASSHLIYADKTHINRIFTNLFLNSIQAVAENEQPIISIEDELVEDKIIIKITDNGKGITQDIQQKIFMPNFTTKTSGTGLGLSMCKRMVEQAGGNISFKTTENGTTFFVEFPLIAPELS